MVPDGVADYVVRLDDYDDLLMPLQLIVPLQLFAYYMAVLRGCTVLHYQHTLKSVPAQPQKVTIWLQPTQRTQSCQILATIFIAVPAVE